MRTGINLQTADFSKIIIKDLVVENYKSAELFQKFGIDFCCHGNRPLEEALKEKQIPKEKFLTEFESVTKSDNSALTNTEDWELELLISHIIDVHHSYVKSAIPQITEYLEKVVNAHGSKYSYLAEIKSAFKLLGDDMLRHMAKEETVLFPLIKYLVETKKYNERPKARGYGSVSNPINAMESEHVTAGDLTGKIRTLSNNYMLPADACNTFLVTYKKLEEFEKDLFRHIHLENNILFPKAVSLEEELNNL